MTRASSNCGVRPVRSVGSSWYPWGLSPEGCPRRSRLVPPRSNTVCRASSADPATRLCERSAGERKNTTCKSQTGPQSGQQSLQEERGEMHTRLREEVRTVAGTQRRETLILRHQFGRRGPNAIVCRHHTYATRSHHAARIREMADRVAERCGEQTPHKLREATHAELRTRPHTRKTHTRKYAE